MFKSAVFKLTAWYVGVLMVVCLMFSLPIYTVASARLQRGAELQTDIVRRLPKRYGSQAYLPLLEEQREQQLQNDRRQLLSSLLFTNLLIISVGAIASYLFARRTLQPIEQSHAAQARFTSDASHELRTPLAVMQTEIEVALRNKKLNTNEAREILSSNLEEVARLRNLSDQLLGLARAGNEPLKQSRLDLGSLLKSESDKLSKRFKVDIKLDTPQKLYVHADTALLRQVLDIIIENAVVYNSTDSKLITIKTGTTLSSVLIDITDNGPGISPTDIPFIFDRFYRGKDASSKNGEGHGLGLALAYDIIKRHEGDILVKSKLGKGTIFTIQLPKK